MTHPKRIAKYEIREPLGRGAVGTVYKGYQKDLDRHVAVKVMIAGEHASERLIQRFMREARAAASLVHPGIVQAHDLGAEGSLHYIVMEWVEGGSLAEAAEKGPTEPADALRICLKVAEALQEAHERGIIHRDIKPSNILLDGKRRPKIADFGLAVSLEEDERLTRTGDIVGTPWYMSPEQAFASPDEVDARTDVYSLGAVLYELLTGRPPFDGTNAFAVLKRIELEEPVPPSARRPELGKRFDGLVLRALEKDPTLRYPTAGDFAAALRESLREFLATRDVSRTMAAPGVLKRYRKRILASAALAGAFALGLAASQVLWPGGRTSTARLRALVRDTIASRPSPERARALSRVIGELELGLERNPADGEVAHWLSVALLEAGHSRRSADLASRAIERGYDTTPSRLHRLYATFVRHALIEGHSRIPYLRSTPPLDFELEMKALRSSGASAAELRLAEAVRRTFEDNPQEAERLANDGEDPRSRTVRQNARLHLGATGGGPPPRAGAPLHEVFLDGLAAALGRDSDEAARLADGRVPVGSGAPAEAFLCRAVLLEHLGRAPLVQENLRIARGLDPDDPFPLLYAWGARIAYEKDLDPSQILQDITPLLSRPSASAAPHVLAGLAHLFDGNRRLAEQSFAAARARSRTLPAGPHGVRPANLARLLSSAGTDEARFLLESGVVLMHFNRPGAEPAAREVLERTARQAQKTSDPKGLAPLQKVRQEAYGVLAELCLSKNREEEAANHLRASILEGAALEDLRADPRFSSLLSNPRHARAVKPVKDDAARARDKASDEDGGPKSRSEP